MLFGIPSDVNRFCRSICRDSSKPIRNALAPMMLAFLLSPHMRRLKTIAGMVLGHRVHVATISRRLSNSAWTTHTWCERAVDVVCKDANRFERSVIQDRKRKYMIIIDTTLHHSVGNCMENLVAMARRKDRRRKTTRHHVFVMGLLITESGERIPLPRRSYYTKEYCRAKNKKYHTQTQLAQLMIRDAPVPANADVTVVYDSAFDADLIHTVCRKRGFREVFPIDPNRNLATKDAVYAPAKPAAPVVASTLQWKEEEFETLELEVRNEDFIWFRRRHIDNLRAKKTFRRYVVAARCLPVSKLGNCMIVASYKENPRIDLLPDESADWKDYRKTLAARRKKDRKIPSRWHGKVLACTDSAATVREIIQWYELRWQIELFFRELKSRMQLGCYVLMKFEAVERYLDFLLLGFLYLEKQRLDSYRAKGVMPASGEPGSHFRTTDGLRCLERTVQQFNVQYIAQCARSKRGLAQLISKLDHDTCHVA